MAEGQGKGEESEGGVVIFGDRTFELPLARDYVSHWGMVEAVRELIQNALDADSPFVYEFETHEGGMTLRLESKFARLTPQTLLLGSTSKRDDPDKIGSFGEGYKIALLVLTRLGYPVEVYNGDVIWRTEFRFNRNFGAEVLIVRETRAPDRRNADGLTFCVHGLTGDDVTQIVDSCLLMQSNVGRVISTSKGDILEERPGKLYVGGLFICTTELQFGYDVKPAYLRLERDRQTVSSWDLKSITAEMWFETKDLRRVAQMVEANVPDVAYVEYGAPELVKEACYALFRENHPGAVAAANQAELDKLVRAGMEKVVVVSGGMHYAVTTSRGYQSEPRVHVASPSERLGAFLDSHRGHMTQRARDAFAKLIVEAKGWKLK